MPLSAHFPFTARRPTFHFLNLPRLIQLTWGPHGSVSLRGRAWASLVGGLGLAAAWGVCRVAARGPKTELVFHLGLLRASARSAGIIASSAPILNRARRSLCRGLGSNRWALPSRPPRKRAYGAGPVTTPRNAAVEGAGSGSSAHDGLVHARAIFSA